MSIAKKGWGKAQLLSIIFLIILEAGMPATALAESEGEATIKAAFIFNFFKFIDWPPEIADRESLMLCADGSGIISDKLMELNNRSVNGKRLVVRKSANISEMTNCNMVFLSEAHGKNTAIAALQLLSVVTVGDGSNFINQGGMIGFVVDENRLAFQVNQDLAQSRRIRINAQLLKLAKFVKQPAKGN